MITGRGSLASVLFSNARRSVLGVLFSQPDQAFYLRELARAAGLAPGAIQRELARLTQAGIILRSPRGNQVHYRANPGCPIYGELVGLISKTIGLADVLREALTQLAPQIKAAFVYGSAARGELKSGSDIDVLIIGDVSLAQIIAAFSPMQLKLAREINPAVYTIDEFRRKMALAHHFLTSVMRESKIFLVGGEHELAGLVTQRLAEPASHQPAGDQ